MLADTVNRSSHSVGNIGAAVRLKPNNVVPSKNVTRKVEPRSVAGLYTKIRLSDWLPYLEVKAPEV